jgi:hypothetical protein
MGTLSILTLPLHRLSRKEFTDPAFGEAVWKYETSELAKIAADDSRKTQ